MRKAVILVLVYIYVWSIRVLVSLVCNVVWYIRLSFSRECRGRLERGLALMDSYRGSGRGSVSDLVELHSQLYSGYYSDGILDWSPFFRVVLMRGGDDCDGSSVIWYNILRYFGRGISVGIYSLVSVGDIRRSHVVVILYDIDGYYLYDYSNVVYLGSDIGSVIGYYKERYSVSGDVYLVRLPF